MSTLKQAFKLFCLRETRPSLSSLVAIKILSEEATTALAGFHADSLAFGDVGFCGARKTGEPGEKPSEHGENQQQTHYTRMRPRSHWWEASTLTSASSLLPGQDVPQYNLNTQIILGLRFQFGRPQCWSQLVTVTQTARFVQFDESCPIIVHA